ncbi:MAG: polysaccharide lyase [Cyclobacteriaceae bacterium]
MLHSKKLSLLSFMIAIFAISSCEEELIRNIIVAERLDSLITDVTEPVDELSPATTLANVIYEETVEGPQPFSTAHDWDVGDWDYALQFVNSPVFKGNRSARFEIQKDQELVANGKRSEVTIIKGAEEGVAKEMWYSFAVLFPTIGYEYDSEREVINQWFQNGSPATSLRTQKDRILLESGNTIDTRVKYDIGAITKDTWHTFVIHFIHSYGSDGIIELWHNGTKKLTIQGGNMYDDILPKWKIGLYKAAFKDESSDVTRRIIYFDNVKVGNKDSTHETLDPKL